MMLETLGIVLLSRASNARIREPDQVLVLNQSVCYESEYASPSLAAVLNESKTGVSVFGLQEAVSKLVIASLLSQVFGCMFETPFNFGVRAIGARAPNSSGSSSYVWGSLRRETRAYA